MKVARARAVGVTLSNRRMVSNLACGARAVPSRSRGSLASSLRNGACGRGSTTHASQASFFPPRPLPSNLLCLPGCLLLRHTRPHYPTRIAYLRSAARRGRSPCPTRRLSLQGHPSCPTRTAYPRGAARRGAFRPGGMSQGVSSQEVMSQGVVSQGGVSQGGMSQGGEVTRGAMSAPRRTLLVPRMQESGTGREERLAARTTSAPTPSTFSGGWGERLEEAWRISLECPPTACRSLIQVEGGRGVPRMGRHAFLR